MIGWYVFVAVGAVSLLLVGSCVVALALLSFETNEAIGQLRVNAQANGQMAIIRAVPFQVAAIEFEIRERRESVRSFAFFSDRQTRLGFRAPGEGPPPESGPPAPPGAQLGGPPPDEVVIVDGVVERGVSPRMRFDGSRLGFAVAALFGVHVSPPVPFAGGAMAFAPDSALFQNVTLAMLATVVIAALIVGLLAASVGKYITLQAIRPLVDVTEALQRFAAGDFHAQPIAVAGRGEFDVLAHAYNAAAEQVEAAFEERDAAEAQMRQFVADAGHELRTPLTIVLGYIDLLRRRAGAGDERSKFIFASIASEGRRMRTLIDNLVLLAKLESDDRRPTEPFDIGRLIEEIANVRRGLDFDVCITIEASVVGIVVADRAEIHEALANIVDNAIKYAPGSPVTITLDSPRGGTIVIAVSDLGPGIPATDREAVFERFFRGARRGEVEGSGLGLAIAKRALERAGGTLTLDPAFERGTRFVLMLRAERVERLLPA